MICGLLWWFSLYFGVCMLFGFWELVCGGVSLCFGLGGGATFDDFVVS